MTDDTTAPATKQDIAMLMEEFGKMWMWRAEVDSRFITLKENMTLLRQEIKEEISQGKAEMKDHFDLVAENIRHDFVAANREEIEVLKDRSKDHGKRLGALEQVVGIAA
jgi:hypothetical protein